MPQFSQNDHPLQIQSPLGNDVLLVDRFEGEENLSSLFEFRLKLRSQQSSIDPAQIIGQSVTVSADRSDGSMGVRYFNGLVTRFENHGQTDNGFCLYSAVMRPWLWLLSQTTDCRIFQQKSALDIVKTIFSEAGSYPLDVRAAAPPQRDYCVQYNETDLAFANRLLEDEGIFYYFRHENGKHTLVLGDGVSALADSAEQTVSFKANLNAGRGKDRLTAWTHGYELRPGKWSHGDYNFETPSTNLLTQAQTGKLPGMAKLELYEFPGVHDEPGAGSRRATIRANQAVFEQDAVAGQSLVETFSPGSRFTVGQHHSSSEQGKQYLLTKVHHEADQSGSWGDSRESTGSPTYTNRFTAVPADTKIVPLRKTARPRIQGPQTAIVVGPSAEEIYTDKYGRIKVQFYWDRLGKKNDNSSCWIRTAQLASGGTFGMFSVPRVGHEVVINFLEGDPDRPLVMGTVYNAANMPPVSAAGRKSGPTPTDAVGAKMQLTLRSNSLGGSGGHNEITMNDTGGAEGLFLKAQKDEFHTVGDNRDDNVTTDETRNVGNDRTDSVGNDEDRSVGNDQTIDIGNDQTITIGNDRTDSVGNDETRTIGNDRTLTVQNDETISVTGDRTDSVTGDETRTVSGDRTDTVTGDETRTVNGDRTRTVDGDEDITISGDQTKTISGDEKSNVTGDKTLSVTGDLARTITGDEDVNITGDLTINVTGDESTDAMQITINGKTGVKLTCGASSIEMTPAMITITAPMVKINC